MKRNFLAIVLIVLLSLLALQTFFQPGMFETHDGRLHIAKLYWFVEALRSGHFPVRWTETANHNYGYPLFVFYYPLLYYAGSILSFAGASLVTSFKIVLVNSYLMSGILFYLLLKSWSSPLPAFVGSILYLFAPYRFSSLLVTGRWAESFSFMFIPLVFWSLGKLAKTGKRHWVSLGALSLSLLILSHNVQSLLFIPLITLWLLLLHWKFPKNVTGKRFLFVLVVGLLGSAFFFIPALYELRFTFQGQAPVYDFQENFPTFRSYLYHPWGYGFSLVGTQSGVSPMIGVAQLAAFIAAVIAVIVRRKKRLVRFMLLLLGCSALVFFLMNRISLPAWNLIPLLPSIQFPSRLTAVLVVTLAMLGGLSVQAFKSYRLIQLTLSFFLVALALWGNRNHLRAGVPDRFSDQDVLSIYQNIFGTGETAGENTPRWSQPLPPPYERKIVELLQSDEPICPNIAIRDQVIHQRHYQFIVENNTQGEAALEVKTIYYPGWKAALDGESVPILYQNQIRENPYGLIRLRIPRGTHQGVVWFSETPLRHGSNLLSLGGATLLLVTLPPNQRYQHRKDRYRIGR